MKLNNKGTTLLEIAACLSMSVFVLFYAYTSGTMTLRLYEKKNVIPEAVGVERSLSAYDTYLPLAAMWNMASATEMSFFTDTFDQIAFSYADSALYLYRNGATVLLLDNVTSASYSFFNKKGEVLSSPVANPDDIARVRVTIASTAKNYERHITLRKKV